MPAAKAPKHHRTPWQIGSSASRRMDRTLIDDLDIKIKIPDARLNAARMASVSSLSLASVPSVAAGDP
jgi:hypothetical protein